MKTSNLFIIILLSILFTPFFYCFAFAKDSVSIIMYHRFGESSYPSTNIQLDRFKKHLEELKNPKYKVTIKNHKKHKSWKRIARIHGGDNY